MNTLWKQLEVTNLYLILPLICEQSTIYPEKEFSSKEYFHRFSHNLIFSFNRKSVNIVYKIENIKGPACVQRQGQGQSKSWPMKSVRLLVGSSSSVGWLFRLFNAITILFHIDHNHIWLVDQEQFLDCPLPPSPLYLPKKPISCSSPDRALVRWVHSGSGLAVVRGGKLLRIGERSHHSDWTGAVHAAKNKSMLAYNNFKKPASGDRIKKNQ